MQTNINFQQLLEHLGDLEDAVEQKTSDDPTYQRFIERFPLDRLLSISLEDYCVGKGDKDSFCYWLERGLEPVLGRYMPGTSKGHIIYFQKDGTVYKNRHLKDLTDLQALEYTLSVQACIASANLGDDIGWIDDDEQIYERAGVQPLITVGNGRKLRLVSCYNPEIALPISSSAHIGHFLKALGCADDDIPRERQPLARMMLLRKYYELAKKTLPTISVNGFMKAIYSESLGLAPLKERDLADDASPDEVRKKSKTSSTDMEAKKYSPQPLNQILYGPPGTGKTYTTIDAALAILDPDFLVEHLADRASLKKRFDELAHEQRVRFVTFHQSFSYEDFVEGLRAVTDDDTHQIRYEVVDGIFKSICADKQLTSEFYGLKKGRVGKTKNIVSRITDDLVELKKPNGNDLPFSRSMLTVLIEGVSNGLITVDDIRQKTAINKLQLQGHGQGLEPHLINGYNSVLAKLVETITNERLLASASTHMSNAVGPRVLIIDEINRGNISRIFGELITLLEPSKRAGAEESLTAVLPYSKKIFSVPKNIYLIGTMNTADRSLAAMDIALRRRFVFREMPPRPSLLANVFVDSIPIEKLITVINQRIEALLGRDYCLGHAYFMSLHKENSQTELAAIFRLQILPLLQEYFFDDWQRIQWVLNDHRKYNDAFCFVKKQSGNLTEIFGDEVNVGRHANSWKINEDAFLREESYLGIINHEDTNE
jgi:5-methylcytosine-specific restriction protein B